MNTNQMKNWAITLGNNAMLNIIGENPAIVNWTEGTTSKMDGDYLASIQDYTLTGFDEYGTEYFWVCNETAPGGEVAESPDGHRRVDLGVCWLDADSGEEISY